MNRVAKSSRARLAGIGFVLGMVNFWVPTLRFAAPLANALNASELSSGSTPPMRSNPSCWRSTECDSPHQPMDTDDPMR